MVIERSRDNVQDLRIYRIKKEILPLITYYLLSVTITGCEDRLDYGLQFQVYDVHEVRLLMTAPTEIRQRAMTLLEQLPGESLIKAVEFLESLSHEFLQLSETSKTPNSETALLQIIQRRLSPEEQHRLSYLRQQNENEEITETEYQELLKYINRIEQQDAERAEALIQLAQLRQVDLKVLIDEFLPRDINVT